MKKKALDTPSEIILFFKFNLKEASFSYVLWFVPFFVFFLSLIPLLFNGQPCDLLKVPELFILYCSIKFNLKKKETVRGTKRHILQRERIRSA